MPVRKSNELSLKEALEGLIHDFGLRGRLDEQAVRAVWPEVAGAMIARHTLKLDLRNGKLTVKVDSAPLREELHYMRSAITELLNRKLERQVVVEIRIA
ncbi:MAG: DUF721 domain-containing protein [Bacteroidetes bacterium]|jgi:predicted nucleic acid-binding Zn ribbon protein|nr:DUF721 domain-containing protein [Bacteroidota bacterium]MBX7129527.1 DUF721 domain-containing protein [Flavobacteriales bacterium]MCC6656164.1 DUF721 domain-containing protein [Flavobacteriales bacterium]HMU15047.1 DUF721 domain-containing protein [Flavobacteriales bacterium]HMZ48390.1 DUF721 domain-containing protein [Flavobacteriales bacterium]